MTDAVGIPCPLKVVSTDPELFSPGEFGWAGAIAGFGWAGAIAGGSITFSGGTVYIPAGSYVVGNGGSITVHSAGSAESAGGGGGAVYAAGGPGQGYGFTAGGGGGDAYGNYYVSGLPGASGTFTGTFASSTPSWPFIAANIISNIVGQGGNSGTGGGGGGRG